MSNYSEDIQNMIYLINKYCINVNEKEKLLEILKNNFSPKYIFSELSKLKIPSKMSKKDIDLYQKIVKTYI